MESKKENSYTYNVDDSADRMDDILDANDNDYCDKDSIPQRSSLTYKNGYYVNVTAIFIDIVGSSDMTDEHKRPTLAKMYRAFLSECVAIMNSETNCKEININGDCVWGVFDTPYTSDIDNVISVAAKLNSMIKILNYKLRKKKYSEISVGIGIDYGRALMVKAGYSGSGINDVIWMGDVVNSACHLCNKAGRDGRDVVIISEVVYDNLNEDNQNLFYSYLDGWTTRYEENIINIYMNDWYKDNCK
jgi:class 3 adenylate cyclase